ncbi:MAG: hypothetical protein OYK82_01230 [Gammaproteobacteria bacterium]|nr:hypothetical protein [Gammaproteobacteria bacterium]
MCGNTILSRACLIALMAAALGASLPPERASAQITAADSAAVLLGTAGDLEQRGERDAAETLYRYITGRFEGTPAAATAGARLDAGSGGQSPGGGETELQVWSTTYGIWLGMMVPLALDADGPEPYGVGLLLGAPGGFFAGRSVARSRPLSLGQARAITWGGTWGALQGMAVANATDKEEQAFVQSMVIGSAAGVAGGMLAARREITPGTATSATLGSLWGSWFGLASSTLLDYTDDQVWVAMMVTGNAGLVGGALAGSRWPLSRSRARLISVGGLIGGVAGLGTVLIGDTDDEDTVIGVALAGSVAGLVLGGVLTQGDDAEADMSGNEPGAGFLPATGALINWSGGDWSLSAPLPSPSLDPSDGYGGRYGDAAPDRVVWKVPLLNVRF